MAAAVHAPAAVPLAEPLNLHQQPFHQAEIPVSHHRRKRMNFYDLANLLDSDGNLQNEMLVFAFAATMLSTIPVLLGNEFDVNVGLRKRRDLDDPDNSYTSYAASIDDNYAPAFFSTSTYKKIMTTPKGIPNGVKAGSKDTFHAHGGSANSAPDSEDHLAYQDPSLAYQDEDLGHLLRDLFNWSQEKTKDKPIIPMLINLGLDKFHGYTNPADKLVKVAYKKWKNFHW